MDLFFSRSCSICKNSETYIHAWQLEATINFCKKWCARYDFKNNMTFVLQMTTLGQLLRWADLGLAEAWTVLGQGQGRLPSTAFWILCLRKVRYIKDRILILHFIYKICYQDLNFYEVFITYYLSSRSWIMDLWPLRLLTFLFISSSIWLDSVDQRSRSQYAIFCEAHKLIGT